MNAPAQSLLALPAPLSEADCAALRADLKFPEGYTNYLSKDMFSEDLSELMRDHVDAANHALIRELIDKSLTLEYLAKTLSSYWFRDDYNALLHNTLLIINHMHHEGHSIKMSIISSATGSITYPDKNKEHKRITTHEEIIAATAIIRFIDAVGTKDANVRNREISSSYYYAITSPHLETLIRKTPYLTDQLITLMKGRRILKTKKGLVPVLLALHNDDIKTLTRSNPELTDKMFDYYYHRNPGTGTEDITSLLDYLDTANALTNGYL